MRSALLALAARSQDPSPNIPQPTPSAPAALEEKIELLLGVLAWVGTTAGVVGVLVTGIMMAVSHRRGELSEHMSRLATVLVGCGLVSVAGPLVTFVFGRAGEVAAHAPFARLRAPSGERCRGTAVLEDAGRPADPFQGYVDDVRAFPRPVSQSEAATLAAG